MFAAPTHQKLSLQLVSSCAPWSSKEHIHWEWCCQQTKRSNKPILSCSFPINWSSANTRATPRSFFNYSLLKIELNIPLEFYRSLWNIKTKSDKNQNCLPRLLLKTRTKRLPEIDCISLARGWLIATEPPIFMLSSFPSWIKHPTYRCCFVHRISLRSLVPFANRRRSSPLAVTVDGSSCCIRFLSSFERLEHRRSSSQLRLSRMRLCLPELLSATTHTATRARQN